jgi:hypothetical protein
MRRSCRLVLLVSVLTIAAAAFSSGTAVAAGEFEAGFFVSSVEGEEEGSHVLTLEDEVKLSCTEVLFDGELTQPTEDLSVTPEYKGCTMAGLSTTVAMNGCVYQLHAGSETGGGYEGTMGIVCPVEKKVVIATSTGNCEVTLSSQSSLSKVEYSNQLEAEPKPRASAKLSLSSVKYNKAKDGFLCPLTGTGEKTNGSYSGTELLRAFAESEEQGMAMGKPANTLLCEEQVKVGCKKTYPKNTPIKATQINAVSLELAKLGSAVSCPTSEITAATEEKEKAPLPLEKFTLTMTGCTLQPANLKCAKVEMTNKNPAAIIGVSVIGTGNGNIEVPATVYLECEKGSLTCEYKSDNLAMRLAGADPGVIAFGGQPLKKVVLGAGKETGCSDFLLWTGFYVLGEPKPVYVSG